MTPRDRGIQRVYRGADPEFIDAATYAVRMIARELPEFTVDDLRARLVAIGHPPPPDKRGKVMGAILVKCAADGVCVGTERSIPSKRRECHNRRIQIWLSTPDGAAPWRPVKRDAAPLQPALFGGAS